MKNKIASLVATYARPKDAEQRDYFEQRLKTIIPTLIKLDKSLRQMDPFDPDFSKRFEKATRKFTLLKMEYKSILNREFIPENY